MSWTSSVGCTRRWSRRRLAALIPSPMNRLIGPIKLAYRYGIEPTNLMKGCAAGFAFKPANDPQAGELQKLISEKGIDHVLDYVAQLRPWNPIAQMIRQEYRQLVG